MRINFHLSGFAHARTLTNQVVWSVSHVEHVVMPLASPARRAGRALRGPRRGIGTITLKGPMMTKAAKAKRLQEEKKKSVQAKEKNAKAKVKMSQFVLDL